MTSTQSGSLSQSMQIHPIDNNNSKLRKDQCRSLFRFVYVQEGSGWILTKSDTQAIHGRFVVWLSPEEDWELCLHAGTRGYHFCLQNFSRHFLDYDPQLIYHPEFLQLLTTAGAMIIDPDGGSWFSMLFKTMNTELQGSSSFAPEILKRYCKIFILQLLRKLACIEQKKAEAVQADIVDRFRHLLEKNFTTKKQVSDYAAELFLSPNYLNAIIRKLTGHPVSYHIRQRIVLEAKRRGAYTDMCMKQVAYELGFDDIPHFSKYFKAATGMNFTDFKQEKYLLSMAG